MRLLQKIRKAFDTGGITVGIETPQQFSWTDPVIPVRVTLTGHQVERRAVPHLDFRLKDVGDGGGPPGLRPAAADRRRPDGRVVNHPWQHLLALHLAPGETRTLDVRMPLPHVRPSVLQRATVTGHGLQLNFGTQWYELSVSAPVEGSALARSASTRLRLTG